MSSVTDPYQPIERQLELTRRLLAIMAERHRPRLVVQTHSPLVARDCDLFRRIEDKGGRVQVNMTVTTDDENIHHVFEPFYPSPPPAGGHQSSAGRRHCRQYHNDAPAAGEQQRRLCR